MLAACPLHVWHPRGRGTSGGGPAASSRAQVTVTPVVQLGPLGPLRLGKGMKFTAAVVRAAPGCPGAGICWNRAGCSGRQPRPGQRTPWTPGLKRHPPCAAWRPPAPEPLRPGLETARSGGGFHDCSLHEVTMPKCPGKAKLAAGGIGSLFLKLLSLVLPFVIFATCLTYYFL